MKNGWITQVYHVLPVTDFRKFVLVPQASQYEITKLIAKRSGEKRRFDINYEQKRISNVTC